MRTKASGSALNIAAHLVGIASGQADAVARDVVSQDRETTTRELLALLHIVNHDLGEDVHEFCAELQEQAMSALEGDPT